MGGLTSIGPALQIGGAIGSAFGQRSAAKAQQAQFNAAAQNERVASEFEAKQADYLAGQAKAVSQIEGYQQRKAAALLASKALANAAGSGAGTSDPTVVDLISDIYAEGAYRSALAAYEGEEQARSYTIAAQARRLGGQSAAAARTAEGANIARAGQMSMFSTLLKGGSSFLDRYGETFSKAPAPSGGSAVTATYGAGPFAGYNFGG
jgi:hypothetical protein